MLKPGYDDDVNAELYELKRQMRCSFVSQYTGREVMLAMSLESARWGDARKDLERGRVSKERYIEIINDAIHYGIVTQEYANLHLL